MSKHTITILNWQPATINELMRSVKARIRLKKSDRMIVACFAKNAAIPEAKTKRKIRLLITLGPRQRGADADAYWKSCLDALVQAKLLRGDSKEWVELLPVEYQRGSARATRIELEDCGL